MTKNELLNSAKNIEKAAKELLAKTSALRTDTGSALQAAKRLESQLQFKEKEAREKAEKEAAQARENAEREAAEARENAERAERAEREAVEARERAEREASEAHERAEREAAQAREKAERKILEEQEKAAERKEKSSIEGQSGTAAPENAENTEKSEQGEAPAEKAEIKPVKETQSREIPGGTEKGTEMQNEKKKSAVSAAEAKTAEKTSKNLESIIRLVKNGSGISSVRSSEHEGGSRAGDKRSGERRQTGDGRQSAEDRRGGERRQTGDSRQGTDDRRNGERRQTGDSRQGAEDRRSGERRQTGDGRQGAEDRRSGERRQTGDSRQSAGGDSRKYGQRSSERGFERSSFDGEKRAGTERQRTGRGTEGRSDTRFPQGKTNSDIRDKDKDSFSGKSRQQSSHYQQHKQDLPGGGRESRAQENKGTYVRTFDIEKKGKNKKTIMKETAPSSKNWEDEGRNYGARRKKVKTAEQHKPEPVVISKAIITTELITVRDFSEKIGKPAAEIIKKLFMMGIIANINQEIDFDTCQLVAMDYEIELDQQLAKSFEETMQASAEEADTEEQLVPRPPVVTIMGHVDHGKTSLLDAIRNSSVTSGEAGGITQHIGAYTVKCNDRMITFIDTPGHEAFTAMRARGAQVTDVVILVVAADDGIMPQTVEAINHSKAANVPIIVAINKIDKPEADPDRVKKQLTEYGLVCEEWGGDVICVPISAKKQLNLDNLLEMVLLQADILELRANPDRAAKGTIIESKLDKGRGPVATVLVQNGTLKVGDPIVAGTVYGKVRAMTDDRGRFVKSAGPSQPVEVLGFNEVPEAGDIMNVAEVSKKVAEERRTKQKVEQMKNLSKANLEDLFAGAAEGEIKTLNLIIKADVHGSVEAVTQALEKLSNDEVHIKCIHGGVGGINESDIMFASASNAIVIGFNVRPDSGARALAEQEKVDIRTYRVIYQAIEDVENAMKGMFKPVYREVQLGTVSVRSIFKISGVGVIAGCYVQEGKVERNSLVRLVRDGIVIHEGKIASLRRFKDDVKEVAAGYECGIGIENFNDISEGDIIEAYIMEEVKR